MRKAMAEAEVGDDVYGEDPTLNRLQDLMAERLGKEAALFVPSGTMANQIAIRVHTRPGDEVILEQSGHSFLYETGALGGVAHVQAHPVAGERGLLSATTVRAAIRPSVDHYARSSLLILENTSNGGGGTIYDRAHLDAVLGAATEGGLSKHLDGARLWNASVGSGLPMDVLASGFDSVSACFSKGLGAPIGSVIAGDAAFVHEAHRQRKMLGGGMRQAGILGAAALYAIEHHVARLADDHAQLARLIDGIGALPHLEVDRAAVTTNIAYVTTDLDAPKLVNDMAARGVLMNPTGPRAFRLVTHMDVGPADIDRAISTFSTVLGS